MHASIDTTDLQDTMTAAAPTLPVLPLVLPIALGLAAMAAGSILTAHPIELPQIQVQLGAGALTVAVAGAAALGGLYAASLWHRARRTALTLEQTPKPAGAPRRRALHGSQAVRPQAVRLDAVTVLRADFQAIATANPTRRIEDMSAFLRRIATRCRSAALALAGVATMVLLAT
jgi:hypothetical protein